MAVKDKEVLLQQISDNLPDNNAGLISASDVRNAILDTADSIENIVAKGDFVTSPFVKNVKLQHLNGAGGLLLVGSGIEFTNGGGTQLVPYLGPQGISHNTLGGLTSADPHTQYIPVNGSRAITNNLALGNHWINSSGNTQITSSTGRGIQFMYVNNSGENVNVGSGTYFTFLRDNSVLSSAKGSAKAWIRFQGSGINGDGSPVVLDSYNVSGIKKEAIGKYTIIFNSGVFKDNNYVALGHSNGRSSASSREDFSTNAVSTSYRTGNDGTSLRAVSFVVMTDELNPAGGGTYADGIVNDLIVFGTEPNGVSNTNVSVIWP